MKTVNLCSLKCIYNANGRINIHDCIKQYLGHDYDIEIKDNELDTLDSLLETLFKADSSLSIRYFNGFYLGYKIPQIGKEFDLLRISNSIVLNIEYKRKISDNNKVKNQAIKNNYYLKFLSKKVYAYTYIKEENSLYKLDEKNNLVQITFQELISILKQQIEMEEDSIYEVNLNNLFEPANYLISPFNKTDDFLEGTYFLTQEQEEAQNSILKNIETEKYFLIEGNAGSGKTLLTYHIAKNLINSGQKVGIIHCGKLNAGHNKLQEKGWDIRGAKYWQNFFIINTYPHIIIIDEIQRIYKSQFNDLITQYISKLNIKLIMSGDEKQILSDWEGKYKEVLAENNITPISYELKSKIRTNKDIANFIKIMLDYGKRKTLKVSNECINIVYFDNLKDANEYIKYKKNYNYISYTPSQYYSNPYADLALKNPQQIGTAHDVIGQEFKNVIVLVNESFFYNGNYLTALKMSQIPYITLKMFFQQITRAINKLEIVVVKNLDLYNKLIGIFDYS